MKNNISRFDSDVHSIGSYVYTGERLSSFYANSRISQTIADIFPFKSKRVLDLGCGDGAYSIEFVDLGASEVVGIDPAEAAVLAATRRAAAAGVSDTLRFEVGNIYDPDILRGRAPFDCVVLRGVLHHLPDPARGIVGAAACAQTMIVLEPNGYNPVLKLIERFSQYHIEHEEQSFRSGTVNSWVRAAGFKIERGHHFNLVPFFCPNWMARLCRVIEPLVERMPLFNLLGCGQYILLASKDEGAAKPG